MLGDYSSAPRNHAGSANSALNGGIVALALLQMICAGMLPLKVFQIPVELLLLTTLLYACTTIRYDRWQVLLLLLLVFVTAGSLFTSESATFLVNAKQNSLAVLSLLYFSKVRFRSALIFPAFMLSLSLMSVNQIAPERMEPFIVLSAFEEFNWSRFGGIFLNAHFNAYFMAIALIYYGYRRRLYGLGVFIIYFTFSKFVLVSYLANLAARFAWIGRFARQKTLTLIVTILAVYILVRNSSVLIEVLDTNELSSATIIVAQLFDPAYYRVLLNPFPSDNIDVSGQAIILYGEHDGYNEIGYFYLATRSGVLLAALYLFLVFKYTRYYRTFIALSLLHFGVVYSPLIIYMLITYSREICMLQVADSEKKRSRQSVFGTVAKFLTGRRTYARSA